MRKHIFNMELFRQFFVYKGGVYVNVRVGLTSVVDSCGTSRTSSGTGRVVSDNGYVWCSP